MTKLSLLLSASMLIGCGSSKVFTIKNKNLELIHTHTKQLYPNAQFKEINYSTNTENELLLIYTLEKSRELFVTFAQQEDRTEISFYDDIFNLRRTITILPSGEIEEHSLLWYGMPNNKKPQQLNTY
ncbi:MAG: hypothetical protein HRT88_13660 [Lentisphaeraceae bacterium]|nr:hypothetical protein [Lentisphaeraceae bacterium]